jgi:deoxyribonuclease IV
MLIGTHISAAGGLPNAPKNSHAVNGEVFQFFSRNPRGGPAPEITKKIIAEFQANIKKFKQQECYIHAPYYINLASSNNKIYYGSISVLREELERGSLLGVKYLMTHLGSAKDMDRRDAIDRVCEALEKILTGYTDSTEFLIEMSAGAGQIIGDTFEEIRKIIENCKLKIKNCLGICFDTAHAFESGYDLRDAQSVKKTLDDFDKIIGLKKLKLIHANDSMTDLGSHHDRHANIGEGKIGLEGFKALVNDKRLKNINLILETPDANKDTLNIQILKNFRDKIPS